VLPAETVDPAFTVQDGDIPPFYTPPTVVEEKKPSSRAAAAAARAGAAAGAEAKQPEKKVIKMLVDAPRLCSCYAVLPCRSCFP
jgi:hypothetical protein